ncbi:sensor histidine kinase [Marinobacterium arenosum]|uniref:sensor histidine kinase n=1 Tax=Marinobacterium arenosum TaxID=2862496 RepID=UPI001C94A741|nr:PAS domain-containing sensor histidine kinase [Marinobacterium arenosum]MBY4675935.1 PAS domain-containing sensor histidine kinase [Marinobacterium arenosum]
MSEFLAASKLSDAQVSALIAENRRLRALVDQQATRQQQAETANEQAESRLRHLLDLMPAGVLLINNSGRVYDCNPAAERMLGTPLVGEIWAQVIERSFSPQSDDGHEISLKSGRRVQLATCALTSEPGQLLLLTDLTETRLLQDRLSHYQRLSEMGRMMASLAHQIRTPLSAALLYMDHLARPDLSVEQRSRFTGKVRSRLENLEQQVRDMLVFARGETKLEDRISTEQFFRDLDDQLDIPLAYHEGDCDLRNDAQGLQFQCNKETLLGAVMNLIENALQAGGNQVTLMIRMQRLESMLQLTIADNGPGMDEATRQKALQPFFTTKSHGTGLGLAVAQVVAHAHHGRFALQSQPGIGTVVSLTLPIYQVDPE